MKDQHHLPGSVPNTPRAPSALRRLSRGRRHQVARPWHGPRQWRAARPKQCPRIAQRPPVASPQRTAAAIPGANRLRAWTAGQIASGPTSSRISSRLLPTVDESSTSRAEETVAGRLPIAVRVLYGAIAAFAVWLLFSAISATSLLEPLQAANQVMCGVLLVFFGTGAAFGLCRIPLVRHACTLTGVWLALSPLFLPGSMANASLFGGLAVFGVAGWAAEAVELSRSR